MEENKNLIIIDPDEIMLSVDEAGAFVFTPQAEVHLERLLTARAMLEKAYEKVQDLLGEVMEVDQVKKIEGEKVIAKFGVYGAKYELTDPHLAVQLGFAKKEEKFSADSKAIDKWAKDHASDLPDGVALRARSGKVTLKLKGEKDDES